MQISSRFTVAIHILAALEISKDKTCTSEEIANSIQNNPVVVRRIISMLKKAGLVNVNAGSGGGACISKPVKEITLFDVYKAVDVVEDEKLFQIHENTNQECIIGANIQYVLTPLLFKAQSGMETVLQSYTMEDVVLGILKS